MDFFRENSEFISWASVVLTVIALVGSTAYTLRNIMRIWKAGKPKPVDENNDQNEMTEEGNDSDNDVDEQNNAEQISQGGDADKIDSKADIDPYEYCEHIQSEVKKAKQRVTAKKLHNELSPDQLQEEREVQRKQLEEIFKLMQSQGDKFGVDSMDDVQHQMKLYV